MAEDIKATTIIPNPDPSDATSERFTREILNTQSYVDGKFDVLAERLNAMDEATKVLSDSVNNYPTDIDKSIACLKELIDEKILSEKDTTVRQDQNLDKRLQDVYNLTDNKFVTLRTVIDSNSEKVALALDASEKAISKAETATDKRFESVNGFQKALNDLSNTMATRRELEQTTTEIKGILAEHGKQLTEQRSRLDVGPSGLSTLQNQYATSQGMKLGSDVTIGKIYGAIGIVGTIIGILVLLSNGVFK